MKKIKIINFILIFLLLFIFLPQKKSFAYEPKTTHAGITEQIIEYYNLTHPKNKITDNEKELIIKGAINEDNPPIRALNHFYDPIHKVGIKGYGTAIEWVFSKETLNKYNWNNALMWYATGEKDKSLIALGHILHLLEDLSVPAHTRNDAHIGDGIKGLWTNKSSFEWWASQHKNRETLKGLAQEIYKKDKINISFDDPKRYFEYIAKFSNKNFFSKDTIFDDNFKYPRVVKFKNSYGYDNEGYKILIYKFDVNKKTFTYYINIENEDVVDNSVLQSYFSRISEQLIPVGANFIELFLKTSEERKDRLETFYNTNRSAFYIFSAIKPLYDAQNYITGAFHEIGKIKDSTLFLTSEIYKFSKSTIKSGVDEVKRSIKTTNKNVKTFYVNTEKRIQTALQIDKKDKEDEEKQHKNIQINTPQKPQPKKENLTINTQKQNTQIKKPAKTTQLNQEKRENNPKQPKDNKENEEKNKVVKNKQNTENKLEKISESKKETKKEITIPTTQSKKSTPTTSNSLNDTKSPYFGSASMAPITTNKNIISKPTQPKQTQTTPPKTTTSTKDIIKPEFKITSFKVSDFDFNNKKIKLSFDYLQKNTTSTPEFSLFIKENDGNFNLFASTTSSTISFLIKTNKYYEFKLEGKSGNLTDKKQISFYTDNFPVVINEIAWMGTKAQANDEWIELYNKTNFPVSLNGWKIETGRGNLSIKLKGTIKPKSYFLLERTSSTTTDQKEDMIYKGALVNKKDINLTLKNAENKIIDKVYYWYAGDNTNKKTMERVSPYASGETPFNWKTFYGNKTFAYDAKGNKIFGTPKAKNSVQGLYTILPPSIDSYVRLQKEASPYFLPYQLNLNKNGVLDIPEGIFIKLLGGKIYLFGNSKLISNGAVFTSFHDDSDGINSNLSDTKPNAEDWYFINISSASAKAEFINSKILYGGNGPSGWNLIKSYKGTIINKGSLKLKNCVVGYGKKYLINSFGKNSSLTIENCKIKNVKPAKYTKGIAIYIGDYSLPAKIIGNEISNTYQAILNSTQNTIIKNNTFNKVNLITTLFLNNKTIFSNNTSNQKSIVSIFGNLTNGEFTLYNNKNIDYSMLERYIKVQKGSKLTIEKGVNIKMGYLRHIIIEGTLKAEGTASEKIKFESTSTSVPWSTIQFKNSTSSVLNFVEISGGGETISNPSYYPVFRGSVFIDNSNVKISNCTIKNSTYASLLISGTSTAEIFNCQFKNIKDGYYSKYKLGSYGIVTDSLGKNSKSNLYIASSTFQDIRLSDIFIKGIHDNVLIKNNKFSDVKERYIESNSTTNNLIIKNNYYENPENSIRISGKIHNKIETDLKQMVLRDLELGKNTELKIENGKSIKFEQNGYLLSHGSVTIKGPKDKKINLSEGNDWRGIIILGKNKDSLIENVKFNKARGLATNPTAIKLNKKAALVFGGGKLQIKNVSFEDNEYALSLFGNSTTTAQNLKFEKNNSDINIYDNAFLKITNSKVDKNKINLYNNAKIQFNK